MPAQGKGSRQVHFEDAMRLLDHNGMKHLRIQLADQS